MGKNELRELRRQAEDAIKRADDHWSSESNAMVAVAKAIMYAVELLADRMGSGATPKQPDGYAMGEELSRQRVINAEMLETLEWIIGDDWNDGIGSWERVRDRIEATITKAKGGTNAD